MTMKNIINSFYILIPFLCSSPVLHAGEYYEPSGEYDFSSHHNQHVEDSYKDHLEEKQNYETMEKKKKLSEAQKEKIIEEETQSKEKSSQETTSLDMSQESTSEKTKLKEKVEKAKKSTFSKTIDALSDYFAKPLSQDLKRLIASSLARAIKVLLLQLLGVYHDIDITTAPLSMLKVKAELATQKKDAQNSSDNIQNAIDAVKNINDFLLNNEQYKFSHHMKKNIKKSTTLSKKVGHILKMTNSSTSTSYNKKYLHNTESAYSEILSQVQKLSKDNNSLPKEVLGSTGIIASLHSTWQLFETTDSSSDHAAIVYATSMTLMGLLQSSYTLTQFVIDQATTKPKLSHPVDQKSDNYFEQLIEDLVTV